VENFIVNGRLVNTVLRFFHEVTLECNLTNTTFVVGVMKNERGGLYLARIQTRNYSDIN
jgi:hypothetical protein